MNCLNAIGSGINYPQTIDTLHLNDYASSGKNYWTATITGSMKLVVVGGGGRGGAVGGKVNNSRMDTYH